MASVFNIISAHVRETLVKDWTAKVQSGACETYEEYKFYVGLIGGAERAVEEVGSVLAKLQREETEE